MSSNWPPWVRREYAELDGRKPEDFRFDQWPVSGVQLTHFSPEEQLQVPNEIVLAYRCDIPASTPQTNVYDLVDGKYVQRPDPTGMALARVRFELRDADTGEVLDQDSRANHEDGKVLGLLGDARHSSNLLWERTLDGPVRVQLAAFPFFYFLADDGGVKGSYFIGYQGYIKGAESVSPVYKLEVRNNVVILDDAVAPPPAELPPIPLTPEEVELQAQFEREQAEYARQRRELENLRLHQQAERHRARRFIDSRRGDYDSDEAWLLGVLHDKSIDFSIRKRVYAIGKEHGIDIDAARRRRQEARAKEEAERKARYEAEQERHALADSKKLFYTFFNQHGAKSLGEKTALLRQVYHDPQWNRFDAAAEAVAEELGVKL